ncbi:MULTISPECIES: alpha/beta hydrolase [unclassified Clostridioides]|uniref:alpha/beta hydrolase n=1 Tax=unclassified Clostridioides TaxID=2635829 RepID=UPI001D0C9589|nr:alpha/beta hydrolase [Clostridioides sp. ES-S-0001-02]MCC0695168.1 alpha/beta hydrolase [Clostridioides sp. ES-S-0048-02]MCC0707932.1 alpha/beta hydrolase [Clostridioides sp. ES-S-0190-01]MCC0763925.1 alpha/beta hydrolase [Clostridioides sp. ES-S-0006-03]UDN60088.1 alpha/beta hydrolase [Clostridioides sp. ES-S-0010-02]UDN60340.1 alpha/beta hydrolase [Clostridioides sp. ES-W-0016-02]
MEKKYFQIHGIPSILWGNPSNKLYIYIHGQCGYKEEAEIFANIAVNHGWQVLSIDLPKHGERKEENISFDPWNVVPELLAIMKYAKSNWNQIALYANSIGAWFSMLSFENENLEECVFVSPILDMQQLISNMMLWANVSEEQLKHELIIPTSFGHTLSWEYLQYVKKHPITKWNTTTRILYGKHDELTELSVVEKFTRHFNCNLTVIANGEHWFNTPEQLKVLNKWTNTLFE